MQIINILLLTLCAVVSAAPFQKRDVATVLSDISVISSDVSTLTTYVTSYTGAANQSLALANSFNSLSGSLQTALTDTSSSYAFDEADSESISHAITTLTPNVINVIVDLMNKKSIVASANYTTVVQTALVSLMGGADNLLTAVTDKVTEEQTTPIGTSADQINAVFNAAINTY